MSGYKMNLVTYTAIIEKFEDVYVANCIEIGAASQGYTIEEALKKLKEATELYLEEFLEKGNAKHSFITTFEMGNESVKA